MFLASSSLVFKITATSCSPAGCWDCACSGLAARRFSLCLFRAPNPGGRRRAFRVWVLGLISHFAAGPLGARFFFCLSPRAPPFLASLRRGSARFPQRVMFHGSALAKSSARRAPALFVVAATANVCGGGGRCSGLAAIVGRRGMPRGVIVTAATPSAFSFSFRGRPLDLQHFAASPPRAFERKFSREVFRVAWGPLLFLGAPRRFELGPCALRHRNAARSGFLQGRPRGRTAWKLALGRMSLSHCLRAPRGGERRRGE